MGGMNKPAKKWMITLITALLFFLYVLLNAYNRHYAGAVYEEGRKNAASGLMLEE